MNVTWTARLGIGCLIASLLSVTAVLSTEPQPQPEADSKAGGRPATAAAGEQEPGVSLEVARDRAQVMHELYSATLETMHHRYFHDEKATVPARALEDVFATIKRQSKAEARWISVNTRPMSIDHAPAGKFEKRAAREMTAGKEHVEVVEDGYYRRAAPIPLRGGCIGCHSGFFKAPSSKPKFAGLVISIPVRDSDSDRADE